MLVWLGAAGIIVLIILALATLWALLAFVAETVRARFWGVNNQIVTEEMKRRFSNHV